MAAVTLHPLEVLHQLRRLGNQCHGKVLRGVELVPLPLPGKLPQDFLQGLDRGYSFVPFQSLPPYGNRTPSRADRLPSECGILTAPPESSFSASSMMQSQTSSTNQAPHSVSFAESAELSRQPSFSSLAKSPRKRSNGSSKYLRRKLPTSRPLASCTCSMRVRNICSLLVSTICLPMGGTPFSIILR